MTTYICTAGTSIVTGTGLDLKHFAKKRLSDWEQFDEEIEIAKQFAMDAVRKKSEPEFPRVSAEVNSLIKMGLLLDDRVVLIATETIEGKLCAELVARVLREKKLCANVEVKIIEGLQAQDGRRFQQVGLKNLVGFILLFEHDDVVFNPTGGFKSVVPYITLAGMLFNKPVKYIHEFSNDLTTLANIPITFDEELILKIDYKLRQIESATDISIIEWQRGIDYGDSRYDCLVEECDGRITMSGIGLLLWERFKQEYPEEIPRDQRDSSEKENKLRGIGIEHHGINKLLPIAERLLRSQYVSNIPNSCENRAANKRKWITPLDVAGAADALVQPVGQEGICIVTDIKSDSGYSFFIKTTAKTFEMNQAIAEILTKKYFL
ncbi:MAG: putative CRISPR-associated protein [Desulfuromonadales bacterium]